MKRILFLLTALMLLNSCALPKFTTVYGEAFNSINLSKGKWLLNSVDAQWKIKSGLDNAFLNRLNEIAPGSVYFIDNIDLKYIARSNFKFDTSDEVLELLKSTTDFNYLINTRARIIKDEVDCIEFYPLEKEGNNIAEFEVVITDIKTKEKLYVLKVWGKVTVREGKKDVVLSDTGNALLFKCMNRVVKKIKQDSNL